MINKKAEAGIGTLILFIAMILVAAIAAGVLIQTSSSLQSKAIDTGQKTQTQVSTSLTPIQMYLEDTSNRSDSSTSNSYNHSFLKVRLAAGSSPIKLDDMLVQVDTFETRQSLSYNGSVTCSDDASIEGASDYPAFGVTFVSGTDNGYIGQGDVVELCFLTPDAIEESSNFRVNVVPKTGQQMTLDLQTPQTMTDLREQIYP